MNPEYWISRWEKDETGFHAPEVQAGLVNAWPLLESDIPKHVLVPLCGKSVDMYWLSSRVASVTGVELSEKACRAFFDDHGLAYSEIQKPDFLVFSSGNISLWCGDLFKLKKSQLPPVNLIYDRASLVALPEPTRKKYAQFLQRLFPDASHLLITFEYQHEEVIGPPFCVSRKEIRALYGHAFSIRELEIRLLKTYAGSKMARHGIAELQEYVILLQSIPKIP